jgi:hypothetical protein
MRRACVPRSDMRQLLAFMDSHDAMLDEGTAERLFQGQLSVDDAPPRYRSAVVAITLAGAEPTDAERAGRAEAVAAIAACVQRDQAGVAPVSRRSPMSTRRFVQLAAASTIGAVTLFGGLAAANALPGAAQSVASDMLGQLGVSVPSPNSNAGGHAEGHGQSDSHPTDASSNGTGSTISDLARNTTATGVDKGAAISAAASDGKSQAGQNGAPDSSANSPENAPPVATPNSGGTSTADTASSGDSTVGTGTADPNSDGHSAEGSANADPGLTHKP